MKIIGNRVLVKKDEVKETTASGIILPTHKRKGNTGVVNLIGSKVTQVKEGDRVMVYDDAGTPINLEGIDYVLLKEDQDIISIL